MFHHIMSLTIVFTFLLSYCNPALATYYPAKEVIGSVYFSKGSLELDSAAREELKEIAQRIDALEDSSFQSGERLIVRLEGYTDSSGEEDVNIFYSLMRAAAVEEYLVSVEKISTKLYLTGFGEKKIPVSESTKDEKARNRRVDIVRIFGKGDFLKVLRMGLHDGLEVSPAEPDLKMPEEAEKTTISDIAQPKPVKEIDEVERIEEPVKAPSLTVEEGADGLNRKGVSSIRSGDFDAAVDILKRALALDENHMGARFNLGFAYQQLSRYEDAEREYRRVLEVEDLTKVHLMLGVIHEKRGEDEVALGEFEVVLASEPENRIAKHKAEQLREKLKPASTEFTVGELNSRGAKLVKAGRFSEAVPVFEEALSKDDKHLGARFNLGFAYQQLARYDDAEKEYRRVLEVEDLTKVHLMLGVIHEKRGEDEAALGEFDKVLASEPENRTAKRKADLLREKLKPASTELTVDELNSRGVGLVKAGNLSEAVSLLEEALSKDDKHLGARFNLGFAYQQLARYDDAEREYRRVLEVEDLTKVHLMLGVIHEKRGEDDAAISEFDTVLDSEPENKIAKNKRQRLIEKSKSLEEMLHDGAAYLKEKNYPLAVEVYKKVIDKRPDDYRAYFNLGLSSLAMGLFQEAKDSFSQTILLKELPRAYLMKGICHLKLGEKDEAQKQFEKVLEIEPDNVEVKKYLKN